MVLSTEWAQVEVVELSNDGNGLGFHLVGGRSTGVVVKHVVPGGAADRDGRLQPGDHLLQVGAVNVRGLSAEQVAGVVRVGCGAGGARLLVARRGAPGTCPPPGAALVPTRLLHDADLLHAHLLAAADPPPVPDPDVQLVAVSLRKNVYGLGITVAGYVCEREDLSGLFVRSIIEGSSAELSGAVRVNDRIVAVDGVSLLPLSNPQAVAVLRDTGLEVHLLLERYLRGPKYEHLRLAAFPDEQPGSPCPSATSLSWFPVASAPDVSTAISTIEVNSVGHPADNSVNNAAVDLDLDSTTTVDAAILETGPEPEVASEIRTEQASDPAAAAKVSAAEEAASPQPEPEEISRALDELLGEDAEALRRRWRAALGNDCEVVVVDLRRAADGLGISVEGTAEVVGGRERDARHFVRGLRAGGVAAGVPLRPGDELLQANAAVLRGAPHAAAVATLRALPPAARLALARHGPRAPVAAVLHAPTDAVPQSHATQPSPTPQPSLLSSLPPLPQPQNSPPSPQCSPPPAHPSPPLPQPQTSPPSPQRSLSPAQPSPPLPSPPRSVPLSPSLPQPSSLLPSPPHSPLPSSPRPDSCPPPPDERSLAPQTTLPPSPPLSPVSEGSVSPARVSRLAMWCSEEEIVELKKTSQGLGFSILDYQDPLEPGGTAIVVRGVVAGGAAAAAGRPARGERVLSVNGRSVRGATLAVAVAALKAAPRGSVRLGLARPRCTPPPSPPDPPDT